MTIEDALVVLHCAAVAPPQTEFQKRLVMEAERVAADRLKKIMSAHMPPPAPPAEERHG